MNSAEELLHSAMNTLLRDSLRLFTLIFATILLVGCVPVSYILILSITRPLSHITQLARSVADGNLDEMIIPKGKDEVSLLESALRDMVSSLKSIFAKQRKRVSPLRKVPRKRA